MFQKGWVGLVVSTGREDSPHRMIGTARYRVGRHSWDLCPLCVEKVKKTLGLRLPPPEPAEAPDFS
jgi:hypothetical protein